MGSKGFQGGFKHEVKGAQVSQGLGAIEVIGTPEFLDLALIPPRLDLSLFSDDGHFIKGFVEKSDIGWIDDGTLQDRGILKHHIGFDGMGTFEMIKDFFFDQGDPLCTEPFSKGTPGGGVHTSFEDGIGDIAKVLDIAVFFDLFDDSSIAELSQAGDEGDRDHGAQGLPSSPLLSVVEREKAIEDGLPGDEVSQSDQLVGGISQMGVDPLGIEGVLKGLCYHNRDLFEGVR